MRGTSYWDLTVRLYSHRSLKDISLAIILREYVAKKQNLPGIRTHYEEEPWPKLSGPRLASNSLTNNGGDFVSARRLLLSRFAFPWLSQLHDLDTVFYCQIMFEACCRLAENTDVDFETTNPFDRENNKKDASTLLLSRQLYS